MNKTPLDSNSDITCYIASPTKLTLPVILLPQLQRVLYSQPHSLNTTDDIHSSHSVKNKVCVFIVI